MSKPDSWMPFYWPAFLVDTEHLNEAQTGAYVLLLGHCWMRGGSVPDDNEQLARYARCTSARWRKHRPVLAPFFDVSGKAWTQKRLTAELDKATKAYNAAVENGKTGGRPRNPNKTGRLSKRKPAGIPEGNRAGNPTGNPTETQLTIEQESKPLGMDKTVPINQSPIGDLSGEAPDVMPINGKGERTKKFRADAVAVLSFLNEKTGKAFEPVPAHVEPLVARFREGFTAAQCRQVVAKKVREWKGDESMDQYLRPKTLFNRTNFANYAGELVTTPDDEGPAP